jgi:hypothetical protein
MTREELLAAFRAMSSDDQQWFRAQTKRKPGRPPKSIKEHSARFDEIEKGKAILGTKEAVFAQKARQEGVKAASVKRRYNRTLDRLTDFK